ncbi:MAG: hypothetical protein GY856_51895 [bacterium]|nr:hypothetical protein [bacterium]
MEGAFGANVDYAQLVKLYGEDPEPQKRYSPAKIKAIEKNVMQGEPDPEHVSTSYVERQNLTMRMSMRRFTRLTNGFSKKLTNHVAAISLYYMIYNFVRPHMTRTTGATRRRVHGRRGCYQSMELRRRGRALELKLTHYPDSDPVFRLRAVVIVSTSVWMNQSLSARFSPIS